MKENGWVGGWLAVAGGGWDGLTPLAAVIFQFRFWFFSLLNNLSFGSECFFFCILDDMDLVASLSSTTNIVI